MEGQISLFDNDILEPNFQVIKGGKNEKTEELLKCYKSKLESVEFMSVEDLFKGYESLKVITYSYDINFINKIAKDFDYCEIILGADFIVKGDKNLKNFVAKAMAFEDNTVKLIKKQKRIETMFREETLKLHTSTLITDHRKIYLLKSKDGKTRVIKASANMTSRAWSGNQGEHYEYDDTEYCYEEYEKDFETAWINSREITPSVLEYVETNDETKDNILIREAEKAKEVIILESPKDESDYTIVEYVLACDKSTKNNINLLEGYSVKSDEGLIKIEPEEIKKVMKHNQTKLQQKLNIESVQKPYPKLTFDFDEKEAFMDGNKIDLNPSKEDVKSNISELLNIFSNYDDFVGDTEKLKETHYKLLNAMFSSPFNAKIRCASKIRGISTSSLPLFLLATSTTANCGKTFTIQAILKMMVGDKMNAYNKSNCKTEKVKLIQETQKGVPVFVDEIDNGYFSHLKPIIKSSNKCEDNQLEEHPMLIFASNDVTEPEEIMRKRMIFLRFEGALPSTIDQSSYSSKGEAIIKRLSTALYREYLRRMLDEVNTILHKIIEDDTLEDTYYTDLMEVSSKILIQILKDFEFEIPEYMKILTWNNDYSVNANYISKNVIDEIKDLWKLDKKSFYITKDTVTISISDDKTVKSWIATLPAEMQAKNTSNSSNKRITINRQELENRLGFKLKNSLFRR